MSPGASPPRAWRNGRSSSRTRCNALGLSPVWAVGVCFVITVAYSAAAGMWAVLWTDFIQLIIKMTAVIVLVYTPLFGIGKLVFGEIASGLALLAVASLCFAALVKSIRD